MLGKERVRTDVEGTSIRGRILGVSSLWGGAREDQDELGVSGLEEGGGESCCCQDGEGGGEGGEMHHGVSQYSLGMM